MAPGQEENGNNLGKSFEAILTNIHTFLELLNPDF